jgi:hypothetical protein
MEETLLDNRYKLGNKLGSGSFGEVFVGILVNQLKIFLYRINPKIHTKNNNTTNKKERTYLQERT